MIGLGIKIGALSAAVAAAVSGMSTGKWSSSMSTSGVDVGNGIAVDSDGNVYVIGSMTTITAAVLIKYNNAGAVVWKKAIGGSFQDTGLCVCVDSSNNIYVAGGNYWSATANYYGGMVFKFNPDGTTAWSKLIGGFTSGTSGNQITSTRLGVDSSGNLYLTGYYRAIATGSTGSASAITTKLSSADGSTIWHKVYAYSGGDTFMYDAAVSGTGNVYAVGTWPANIPTTSNGINASLVKLDTSGTMIWSLQISGTSFTAEYGYGVCIDSSENVYVVGKALAGPQAYIMKLDSAGTKQWARIASGVGEYHSVCYDGVGNVYAVGYTTSAGSGLNDIFIVKYNTAGVIQWKKILGGTGQDYGLSIAAVGDFIYLTGSTESLGNTGSSDIFTIKLPADGTMPTMASGITYANATPITEAASTLVLSSNTANVLVRSSTAPAVDDQSMPTVADAILTDTHTDLT